MSDELQAEVVPPPRRRARKMIVPVACGLLGVAAGALGTRVWMPPEIRTTTIVVDPLREPAQPDPVPVPVAAPPPAPSYSPSMGPSASVEDVAFVLSIGGQTYVEMDTQELPPHAAPTMVDDAPVTTAIAEVAAKDLPDDLRAWRKKTFSVDGACKAHVTGFAVIARLVGSARDAGYDLAEGWTEDSVLENGQAALFARLDGCSGTFARDATLPAIAVLAETNAPGNIAERALARLESSQLVADAQAIWRDAGNDDLWYQSLGARVDAHLMRHPWTGERWVVVHAYRYRGCGQDGGNVVGIYRVDADGALETLVEREGTTEMIDHVIDLDGDGVPELVGSTAFDVSIERANGDSVRSLGVASFGCGC